MIELRQSTAGQVIPLGYYLDNTDGDTEETGLTIANTDIKIWKWGATTLANKNSGGATHISNGVFYATLDATDTNTLGALKIFTHISGALTVILECAVVTANYWDSKYSTDYRHVDIIQVAGVAEDIATETKQDTIITNVGNLNDFDPSSDAVANVTLVATTTTNSDMITAATIWAYGTRTLSSFGTLIVDIWTYVTRVLTAGTNLNDVSEAEVNAQCDLALSDYDGPTRAEATADKDEIIAEVDANEAKIDTVISNTVRILGLVHENIVIDNIVYSGDTATSARKRIFPTEADAIAGTNELDSYPITISYTGDNLIKYLMTRTGS